MASNSEFLVMIYEIVKENRGCTRAHLARTIGCTVAAININVANMIRAGALYEIGHYVYPLYKQAIQFMWEDKRQAGHTGYIKAMQQERVDLDAVRTRIMKSELCHR